MQSGAQGVGLLRSSYMMLPGRILDEQEQYFFYISCLAAAQGKPVTVRTFDFGTDRTVADAYRGVQSSKLGLRGIRSSLRQPHQFQTQICALLRAAARGPLRVMLPMVTDIEDWDAAMEMVEDCRRSLRERGVPFNEDTPFGVMLSIPSACLTAEDFAKHGCDFFTIGTNDLTQYTHAADRELASAERYYRPGQPRHEKADPDGGGCCPGGRHPGDHLRAGRGQPRQRLTVLSYGASQFFHKPAKPAGSQKSPAGSRVTPLTGNTPADRCESSAAGVFFAFYSLPQRPGHLAQSVTAARTSAARPRGRGTRAPLRICTSSGQTRSTRPG